MTRNTKFHGTASVSALLGVVCLLAMPLLAVADTVDLINESFATGNYNPGDHSLSWTHNGQTWTWSALSGSSSPNDTETYGPSAMSVRGMRSLGVNGGFEVNSDPNPSGTWMVDTKVTIPVNFNSLQPVTVGFDYGFRGVIAPGTVAPSSFSLVDLTTGSTLFTSSLTAPDSGQIAGVWQRADYVMNLPANLNPGDVVDLQWKTASSSSAVSLEVGGAVVMSITAAPGAPAPPMTACIAFAGVLVLQALRRRDVAL